MYTENGQQRFSSLRASQFSFNHVQIQSYITKLLDHSEIGTHAVVNRLVNAYLTLKESQCMELVVNGVRSIDMRKVEYLVPTSKIP